jgi:SAM-dependent methyltransferase
VQVSARAFASGIRLLRSRDSDLQGIEEANEEGVMIRDNTNRSWERIARNNPYYGVLTEPQFRSNTLSEKVRGEFFDTGANHFSWIKTRITQYFGTLPTGTACDFGCGVGRLLIPFAKEFEQVTGIDVSPTMLSEARRNYERLGIDNIILVHSNNDLADFRASFDFIHSYLVLQHLSARRGEKIIQRLLSCLSPGGIFALQFFFHENVHRGRAVLREFRKTAPPFNWALNLIRGHRWNDPLRQHNIYNLGNVLWLVQKSGIAEAHIAMIGVASAFIFGKKMKI